MRINFFYYISKYEVVQTIPATLFVFADRYRL